jgi:hypothetical protein
LTLSNKENSNIIVTMEKEQRLFEFAHKVRKLQTIAIINIIINVIRT